MNRDLPYVVVELANVHAGDKGHLLELIQTYKRLDYPRKGLKFQIFKPDEIALQDYEWFPVYEELYFGPEIWSEAIALASTGGDVWLDIFDGYSIDVLVTNSLHIRGIKLQASVLENSEVFERLSRLDLAKLLLVINVSGFELSEIYDLIRKFDSLSPLQLILQVGFQSYPTAVEDTALQKIAILRAAFPEVECCLADHSPGADPISRRIPIYGYLFGCNYIEKHFCLSRAGSKYDHFSALESDEMQAMLNDLCDAVRASSGSFIPNAERTYLAKSKQVPVLRWDLRRGAMVGGADLCFRRTSQSGLSGAEIRKIQQEGNILAKNVSQYCTLTRDNFLPAAVGVIVACRMKSSRLRDKAILPIQGVPSVERCLANCLEIPGAKLVVLATSDLPEDAILKDYTLNGRARFFQGDPDDVIHRYLGACDELGIDVIMRVTADCPVVSGEILEYLLARHFESGADYTAAEASAPGTAGEIYNAAALRRVIEILGKAEYSEYMTWYMRNNPEIFKVNIVKLPPHLVREFRLTLDYSEDLEMFERLYSELSHRNLPATLASVFRVLDENEEIAALNRHCTLSYKTDQALIAKLDRVTKIRGPEQERYRQDR